MLTYFLISSTGIGISYLLYILILKKEKTFVFNRFFLLTALALSLISPTLKFNTPVITPIVAEINPANLLPNILHNTEEVETVLISSEQQNKIQPITIFLIIYIAVSLLMLIRFSRNLIRIYLMQSTKGPKIDNLQIVYLSDKTDPFSFFNYVFVNKVEYKDNSIPSVFLKHELAHSKQLHTLDILLVEIIGCFFWFNPFIWLYKKAIAENHEYLADQFVTKDDISINEYSQKLIYAMANPPSQKLTSGFSFMQTKNRIKMLRKSESPFIIHLLKILVVILIFSITIACSSFNSINPRPFVVVVDAGHGGHDPGVEYLGLSEKEIVLSLANRLKEIDHDKSLKIIQTRSNDTFLGLYERLEFAKLNKADLFLSLHLDMSKKNNKNGFEVFYSMDNKKYLNQSFANSLVFMEEQLPENYKNGAIKTAPYFVLKRAEFPSVLVSLGFLNNDLDRKNLQNPEYLDDLASALYSSLLKIKEQTSLKE